MLVREASRLMLSELEIWKLRERLIQAKHDYYGGCYDIWVARMEQLNEVLQIEVGTGSICGNGDRVPPTDAEMGICPKCGYIHLSPTSPCGQSWDGKRE